MVGTKEAADSLARILCSHAQEFNYDHGPNPTILWEVGACPRHLAMAYQIVPVVLGPIIPDTSKNVPYVGEHSTCTYDAPHWHGAV